MNSLIKQFAIYKNIKPKVSIEFFFIILIIFGIPLNLYKNRFYDNSWNVGEWLISYAGGFVRRGLPGEIINYFSNKFLISPILIVWIFSVISFLLLTRTILYFAKDFFDQSFLLSQLILLAPISGDYLVRKDSFIVCMYGLCLIFLKKFYKGDLNKTNSLFLINFFSIIAILSHESYGIWASPSLAMILYLFEKSEKKNNLIAIRNTILSILPILITFILCWVYKGDLDQSIKIHESWQDLKNILPSLGSINYESPDGAISAIGWGTSQVYSKTLLTKFNLGIFWHPGMWLLTIYISIKLFIGYKKNILQKIKRKIICMQLISFLPMFIFVDIGRWIFMWLTSSAFLVGFYMQIKGLNSIIDDLGIISGNNLIKKLLPGFSSFKVYRNILLIFGLPHCCWSVGRYIVSNPIGFAFKNIIFYLRLLIT